VLLYLKSISTLYLKLSKGENLEVASNILFADNTLNRKSTRDMLLSGLAALLHRERANKILLLYQQLKLNY
jgi:hypothetical protein